MFYQNTSNKTFQINGEDKVMKGKKVELWRLVVGIISIAYIIFMWVKKDIVADLSAIPAEALLPLILTNVGVSLLKILAIAAVVFLIKWLITKFKNKNRGE